MKPFLYLILFLISSGYCAGYGGELSQPKEATYTIKDDLLTTLSPDDQKIVLRYLSGNSRWEIRKERGYYYAIRREIKHKKYHTTLNGFYSEYQHQKVYQRRVIVVFGKYNLFRWSSMEITGVIPKKNVLVKTTVEYKKSGNPGYSSYTIFKGNHIYLEIYDQNPERKRVFTQKAYQSVIDEIKTVLKQREAIIKNGVIAEGKYYKKECGDQPELEIKNGMQRGIYLINSCVNPRKAGEIFMKVFDVKTGKQLSKSRINSRSTRYSGWGDDPKTLFPYHSEITVYEGDWSHQYRARFELWHRDNSGKELKLLEKSRMIYGWER